MLHIVWMLHRPTDGRCIPEQVDMNRLGASQHGSQSMPRQDSVDTPIRPLAIICPKKRMLPESKNATDRQASGQQLKKATFVPANGP